MLASWRQLWVHDHLLGERFCMIVLCMVAGFCCTSSRQTSATVRPPRLRRVARILEFRKLATTLTATSLLCSWKEDGSSWWIAWYLDGSNPINYVYVGFTSIAVGDLQPSDGAVYYHMQNTGYSEGLQFCATLHVLQQSARLMIYARVLLHQPCHSMQNLYLVVLCIAGICVWYACFAVFLMMSQGIGLEVW